MTVAVAVRDPARETRTRELELGGVALLEGTAAAVERVVHEQTVWMLLGGCLDGLEGEHACLLQKRRSIHLRWRSLMQGLRLRWSNYEIISK